MNVSIDFSLNTTDGTSIQFFSNGLLKRLPQYIELSFVEQTETKLDTIVEIYLDKVIITRTGKIYMKMEFNPLIDTTVVLKTENNFEVKMLNKTQSLLIEDDKIEIIYQTEMDKEHGVHHQLKIIYQLIEK